MHRNNYSGIDPLAVSIALSAARKAIGHSFTESDLPDLEQELVLAALNALRSFDPERGNRGALIKTAVTRQLIDLLRYRCYGSRDYRMTSSLNKELRSEDGEFSTLLDMVASDGTLGGLTLEQINPYDQEFLNSDVQKVVSRLPVKLQTLCQDMQSMPEREVAIKNGISAVTLGRRIAEIRNILEDFT